MRGCGHIVCKVAVPLCVLVCSEGRAANAITSKDEDEHAAEIAARLSADTSDGGWPHFATRGWYVAGLRFEVALLEAGPLQRG